MVDFPSAIEAHVVAEPVIRRKQGSRRNGDGFTQCKAVEVHARYRVG